MIDEVRAEAIRSTWRLGIFAAAGAVPVLSISGHVFGLLSMDLAARYLVLPLVPLTLYLALGPSVEARLFRRGLLIGLVAVTLYDSTRLPFVLSGVWPDFIPDVGGWVIPSDDPNAVLGYVWRYVGNGGGIAIFFVLACATLGLRRHLVPLAVGYGVFVWSGLMGTVVLAENGERLLFEVTPLSITLSLTGHLVYGAVLGWLLARAVGRDPGLTDPAAGELPGVAHLRRAGWLRAFR